MSLINGGLPGDNKSNRKSSTSRIIAPNGSIISNASGTRASNQNTNSYYNSKRGSVVSQVQSEKHRFQSGKCGSVVSGVSSQVARRKMKKDAEGTSVSKLTTRSMSVNSLGRRSNDNLYEVLSTKSKSQSVMSMAVAEEIQMLGVEEREIILKAIKNCKQNQKFEDRRKQILNTKINEIKSMRPPFPISDPKMCYICYNKFWPIFSKKIRCSRCALFVCKNCFREYKMGSICSNCALEILYTAQIGSIFHNNLSDDIKSDDDLDISTIERMIKKTTELEQRTNLSNYSNDHVDVISNTKSKSGSSIVDRLSLHMIPKKKKDSLGNSTNASFAKGVEKNEDDQKSLKSKTMLNSHSELSDNENNSSTYGEIMIGLSYNYNKKEFIVLIKSCLNLPAVLEKQNTSNPYVKVVLLPEIEGENFLKTKVKYSTLNPVFNEQCVFKNMNFEELFSRTLFVTVIHCENLGKDIFLGQTLINLSSHSFENASAIYYQLKDKRPDTIPPTLSKYFGDIRFSLKYSKSVDQNISENYVSESISSNSQSLSPGCLILWINQANNLFSSKYNKLPNSYVKCVLLPEISFKTKKKTQVIRKSFNPIWNIQFTYPNISRQDLKKIGLEITVWDKKLGFIPDVLLGGISMNLSRGDKPINKDDTEVWMKMMEKSETWIEAVLTLRTDIR